MKIQIASTDAVLLLATGVVTAHELQSRLRDLGYYDGPPEPQPWPQTLEALQRFQHDHGLRATGCTDAATMAALREAYCY